MPGTNIVFVNVTAEFAPTVANHLAGQGIGVTSAYGATKQRWGAHRDVGKAAVATALAGARDFFAVDAAGTLTR